MENKLKIRLIAILLAVVANLICLAVCYNLDSIPVAICSFLVVLAGSAFATGLVVDHTEKS